MFHAGYDPAAGAAAREEWMSFGDSGQIAETLPRKWLGTVVRLRTWVFPGGGRCPLPWLWTWPRAWGSLVFWKQPYVARESVAV